eukprot:m.136548 g.136548  ORF g.136548 m.136548 type:complete len:53 (-) comp14734_c0_seq3:41-199(-)
MGILAACTCHVVCLLLGLASPSEIEDTCIFPGAPAMFTSRSTSIYSTSSFIV